MNKILISLLTCAVCASVFADVNIPADKSKFKIVILAGQSNMAGRGIPTPADTNAHPRVVMMNKDGKWVPCKDPIHYDKRTAGVGPGKTFAEALAETDPSITVGVVPCAVGGTSIGLWVPDAEISPLGRVNLFSNMVFRANKAMEQGTLTAILWHQGESDLSQERGYLYQPRFLLFIDALRRELKADGIPFICGGLYPKLMLRELGKIQANTQRWACEYAFGPGKYVPCPEDCVLNRDKLHYSRDSQVEFGKRYFAAYQEVVKSLAANNDYWKNPESEAAKLTSTPIPDWTAEDADKQIGAVPEKLPETIERWIFPNGRPVKDQ